MIAVDTNVLARYLLNDEPKQARAAAALLASDSIVVPPTVLLELVWVLRVNDCDREAIIRGLRHLLGLPNLSPLQPEAVLRALSWFEAGMDFSDALHLALSSSAETMYTFDRDFVAHAKRVGLTPVVSQPRGA